MSFIEDTICDVIVGLFAVFLGICSKYVFIKIGLNENISNIFAFATIVQIAISGGRYLGKKELD